MTRMAPTVHASAVLIGAGAILVRGPSGSGKSDFVLRAVAAAETGLFSFARLVADDRVELAAIYGRLIVRPPEQLAGLIEVRSLGIRRTAYEPMAVVSLVLDLADPQAKRLPDDPDRTTVIEGVTLPRLSVPPGVDPLPIVAAMLDTARAGA